MIPFNIAFGFFAILAAALFDVLSKYNEVPDWLSYGTIIVGIISSLMASILYSDYHFILYSLIGAAIGFLIGGLLYWLNQWGGADFLFLIGIGSLIGFNYHEKVSILLVTIINIFIMGAVLGALFSFYQAIKHWKKFKEEFKTHIRTPYMIKTRAMVAIFSIIMIVIALFQELFIKVLMIGFAALVFFMFYFYVFTKVVEKTALVKSLPVKELTEGDWLMENVTIGKKTIFAKKAIDKNQLTLLKKHKKKVLVRYGMPFLPSFLAGYILTIIIGNWFYLLL